MIAIDFYKRHKGKEVKRNTISQILKTLQGSWRLVTTSDIRSERRHQCIQSLRALYEPGSNKSTSLSESQFDINVVIFYAFEFDVLWGQPLNCYDKFADL